MKILDGAELAGFIKERQLKQVRALRQSWRVLPRLAIVQTTDAPVIDMYVRLKQVYGADILVEVDIYKISQADLLLQIETLNADDFVHGIIIQLPLVDTSQTDTAVNAVASEKDVDGLGKGTSFTPATAMAIDWLLAGYNQARSLSTPARRPSTARSSATSARMFENSTTSRLLLKKGESAR